MTTITEWTAIVLLSLGVIKMIVGIISPKHLLDIKKNPFSKLYLQHGNVRMGIFLALGSFMIYVSLMSNLTLAQWFVAGYTMLVIFVSFLFFSDEMMRAMMDWFSKIHVNKFRLFCVVMLALEVLALYIIVY
jgi:hypothetical protein